METNGEQPDPPEAAGAALKRARETLTENISLTSHPLALPSKSRFMSTSPFVAPLSNSNDHGSSSFSSNREPLHLEMAVSVWKVSLVAVLREMKKAIRD